MVTAELRGGLERFGRGLSQIKDADPASRVQAAYLAGVILSEDHDDLAALAETETHRHVTPPPGMPIGGGEDGWFSEVAAP